MEKVGIVFGCFIPMHKGHESLIKRALEENDKMIIGVCGYRADRGRDFLDFEARYKLVQEMFAEKDNVIVVQIDDKKLGLDGTFTHDNWVLWGDELFFQAGRRPDDAEYNWYTGEQSYIDKLKVIYPAHKFTLVDREIIKASGTEIRKSPAIHSDDINDFFKSYLRKNGKLDIPESEFNMDLIISSLLETDLYKFSMGQAIYHNFPDYTTTWSFKCRNQDVHFTPEMVDEIKRQIYAYCDLSFTEDELEYLSKIKWMKKSYIDFLRLWHPRYEDFTITTDAACGLAIETNGTWLNTSMYEIPTLAIVNEVYFRMNYDYKELYASFEEKLTEKIKLLTEGTYNIGAFSEFGLRRRLSAQAQELAVTRLRDSDLGASKFVGTSNVYLAKKCNVTPVGTMAHEWIMCVGQGNHKHNPAYSNWYALEYWVKEYGILNGTALTDAITTDCFLRDFQLTYSTLFSGVRHDSGDPIEWGEKMIKHYESLGIDPKTKTLLFSDSLDFERASNIFAHFNGKAKVAFGIGTYIANDTKEPALNIVMKTTACNGQDVAKISDVVGKGMCKNPEYVEYLQRCIDWRMEHEA
nr:nicotinate phosphoribosyltransferase [Butyrivibrio sp. MC2021]